MSEKKTKLPFFGVPKLWPFIRQFKPMILSMIALNLVGPDNTYPRMFIGCAIISALGAVFSAGIKYTPKETGPAEGEGKKKEYGVRKKREKER